MLLEAVRLIYWSFITLFLANNQNSDDLYYALSDNYIGSNHYIGDEGYVFNPSTYVLSDVFLMFLIIILMGSISYQNALILRLLLVCLIY
ncbi:hypothetical protein ID855_21255 [Xenorhabdus sp. ZM]|uniref:hypothetical protein n=1 Tax=Xenorhabdus szentirmaii TaxID=290112 RepID=UPI0019C6BF50|nr:hypothetical protein [Xenorhabdus sp. ZM]MBD2807135.1 hypothetical protein [Xenorhabdus sp. ZM]